MPTLGETEARLRRILERYTAAQQRGDYLEAILGVHTALEDTFDAHLPNDDTERTFMEKAGEVLGYLAVSHDLETLNRKRSWFAHPRQAFPDAEYQQTAYGFVEFTRAAWPRLFHGARPEFAHPGQNGRAGPGRTIQAVKDSVAASAGAIPWDQLGAAMALALVVAFGLGLTRALWQGSLGVGAWTYVSAGLLVALTSFTLRAGWRFARVVGAGRLLLAGAALLMLLTLLLAPFTPAGGAWPDHVGAALTRVLYGINTALAVSLGAAYDAGAWLAGAAVP